jgi:AcrR family transcriptional regulator
MGVAERKARDFQRREGEILSAALSLFGRKDWQSVTMDDIAETAEIGKGTIYKHFKSKDEVCARLVLEHSRGMLDRIEAVDRGLPPTERIGAMVRAFWNHSMGSPELLRLAEYCDFAEDTLKLSPAVAQEYESIKARINGAVAAVLQEGVSQGRFADVPVSYIHLIGWAALLGSRQLIASGQFPEVAPDHYLEFLVAFLLRGAGAGPA